MAEQDPYQVLGVVRYADDDEVEQAYLSKLAALSDDASPEQRRVLTEAYSVIKDVESRAAYNIAAFYGPRPPVVVSEETVGLREVTANELHYLLRWLQLRITRGHRLRTLLAVVVLAMGSLVPFGEPILSLGLIVGVSALAGFRARRFYRTTVQQQAALAAFGAGLGYLTWTVLDFAAESVVAGLVGAAILVVGIPLLLIFILLRALAPRHYYLYD